MLLELGSGDRPHEDGRGWQHNDQRDLEHIEIVCDATDVAYIMEHVDEPIEEIRATHLLEHFPFHDTVNVLNAWVSMLAPGGKLYLEVPHIFGHVRAFQEGTIGEVQFIDYVYGSQDYDGNFHKAGFSPRLLEADMEAAGLVDIRTQDIGMVIIASGNKES